MPPDLPPGQVEGADAAPRDLAAADAPKTDEAPPPPEPPKKKQKKGLFGKIVGAVGDAVKGVINIGKQAADAVGDVIDGVKDAAQDVLDSPTGQLLRRAAGAALTFVAPPVGLAVTAANAAYDGVVNGDWKGALASGAALAGGAGLISAQAATAAQQGVAVLDAVERGDTTGAIVGALGGAAGVTGDPTIAQVARTAGDVSRAVDAVEAASDGNVAPAISAIAGLAA